MEISKTISWCIITNEAIISDSLSGKNYNLSTSGTQIFKLLLEGNKQEEIISKLVKLYGEDMRNTISLDVTNFIKDMINIGVIINK